MSWKVNKTSEIYKNKWMTITQDEVETETGYKLSWGVVHKKPAVLVIPWDGKFTYIVGQYRYPVDYYSWEFVQGHADHDTIAMSAAVELEEEAGLKAVAFDEIGRFFPAPGHNTQEYCVFLATKLSKGIQNPEPDEVSIKVKKITVDTLERLINTGKIKDGPTICAFSLLKLYLSKK